MKKKCSLILFLLISFLLCGSVGLFPNNEAYAAESDKDIVIVLDPGHDSTYAGASHYGYKEHELVFKIASYCKAELEQYDGVKVYMTRYSNACPYDSVALTDCMKKRAEYAKGVGADVYISFHLNASENGSVQGAAVYYPNSNYYPSFGTEGKKLATNILTELKNLGISQWGQGLYIRNSEDGTKYPDGSLADYLAVIRNAKLQGIPAVLIEHAFLSNHSDVTTFLNTDAKLQKIGIADATAIADYYGLTKGSGDDTDDTTSDRTLVKKEDGKWYCVSNGGIDHYTGVVEYYGSMYYVCDGVLDWNYTGLAENEEGLWYVKKGKVDFTRNGLVSHNGTWYHLRGGYVDTSYSDLVLYNGKWYYVKNGKIDWTYSDIVQYGSTWYCVKNAQIAWDYTGLAQGHTGWWYIKDGRVDFTKNGLVSYNGTWYHVINGYLNWSYSNLVSYNGTLYYVKNGSIDWSYSDIVQYNGTWYCIKNAQIAWNYTGLAHGHTGWWYIKDGKVDFTKNGLVYYNGTWYHVINGYLNWSYSNLVYYNGTWYYVKNGQIDWNYSEVVFYNGSLYYVRNGALDWNYTGIAGTARQWYVKKGMVDQTYNGVIIQNGVIYSVVDGQALENGTAIMGDSSVTVDQMVKYYNVKATYPEYYANSDAPDIETFCQIYLEECETEGVKAEVAFAQAMMETGFLKFGGQVDISQYNFAGIGAVDGGVAGATFPDVRTGVRAHIQHLKAYACDDSLNQECVDPRFNLVKRGCAPYVEWLGIQENPNTERGTKEDGNYGIVIGRGWASAKNYGFTLRSNYIEALLNTK